MFPEDCADRCHLHDTTFLFVYAPRRGQFCLRYVSSSKSAPGGRIHGIVVFMAVSDEAKRVSPISCATLSDAGTERGANEVASGIHVESPTHVLVAVADGVSGEEGAAIASTTAIEVTLRAYRESPPGWGPAKRIYRAVQQANIEIHDRALVVTELRRMATTLTAVVVDGPTVHAAHVGDTRLYSIRGGEILQRTKDRYARGAPSADAPFEAGEGASRRVHAYSLRGPRASSPPWIASLFR